MTEKIKKNYPVLPHRIVSLEESKLWPVDQPEEFAEGSGDNFSFGRNQIFNFHVWPARVVIEVTESNNINAARVNILWRRSELSMRNKGLKLIDPDTGNKINDVIVESIDKECIVLVFRPVSGSGTYYLYYGSNVEPQFKPDPTWLSLTKSCKVISDAKANAIEARCSLDSFYPMETIALKSELDALMAANPDKQYLVFAEDRDKSIRLETEIPAHWAVQGPTGSFKISADRNEYRAFQLGL